MQFNACLFTYNTQILAIFVQNSKYKNMINLEPKVLWGYFHQITQIPRPSKKEEKILAFLIDFAKQHQLNYKQDDTGNLLISKSATPGYENKTTLILQAHVDMVCEKNADVEHDFDNDPIQAYVDGDWVKAKGTTLGADNGIGVAIMMAILAADDIPHPALECLFTVDEETGLGGAYGLSNTMLTGATLINLDSEDDGQVFIGCAGGIGTKAYLPYETEVTPKGFFGFKVSVTGVKGGHSGGDIHLGLANAIKVLTRYLWQLNQELDLRLFSFEGGNLHNAIPREASAWVAVPHGDKERVRVILNMCTATIEEEYKGIEPNFKITLESDEVVENCIKKVDSDKLINLLYALPHGVIAMSRDIPDLVETSTNLASVKMMEDARIEINTSQRSSSESIKFDLASRMRAIFDLAGAEIVQSDGYPGWKPNLDSAILENAKQAYAKLFGEEPAMKAIHAGLECGIFLEKYPHLDMISMGPQMYGVHSPDERMSIASAQKTWKWLLEILKSY